MTTPSSCFFFNTDFEILKVSLAWVLRPSTFVQPSPPLNNCKSIPFRRKFLAFKGLGPFLSYTHREQLRLVLGSTMCYIVSIKSTQKVSQPTELDPSVHLKINR